ncbi:SirB2 family protein [Seongchinamella unica]|uniref:SirB2 family protein n=1 Tax=Seongchinamella unica TaxID=2547392 RepID=UPI001404C6ED|nr:SirB2 family protein [Seongchinamella unica]
MTILKFVHVCCGLGSVAGFSLRGYWALTGNPRLQAPISRVLPHLVDSVLLASAVGMLGIWGVSPLALPWVVAKVLALLLYIGLGMTVMRFATSKRSQLLAYVAALATAAYIIAVALTHSPWGPLELLG